MPSVLHPALRRFMVPTAPPVPMIPASKLDAVRQRRDMYQRLYCNSTAAHAETLARLAEVTAERDQLQAALHSGSHA